MKPEKQKLLVVSNHTTCIIMEKLLEVDEGRYVDMAKVCQNGNSTTKE